MGFLDFLMGLKGVENLSRTDLTEEEEFETQEINLPPEMDIDDSFKEGSLDELIGLAPEKEEKHERYTKQGERSNKLHDSKDIPS